MLLKMSCTLTRTFLFSNVITRRRITTMGKNSKVRNRDKDWYDDSEDEVFFPGSSPVFSSFKSEATSQRSYTAARMPTITLRNATQEKYFSMLENPNPPIVIASGPAGSAKTYLCNCIGMKNLLNGTYEKLIITRPAVSTDEEIGFLPGTLEDKMMPWMTPIYDVFHKFIPPSTVKSMIAKGQIEICPLAFMRGRTFDNAFIVADEMQNSTPNQMLMMLTRIGENSKMVITGDIQQHDRKYFDNGLKDFLYRLKKDDKNENFGIIEFTANDIVRHPVIKEVLEMYKD